jgi:hypothetical protein
MCWNDEPHGKAALLEELCKRIGIGVACLVIIHNNSDPLDPFRHRLALA